jgi:hypothetical protein
MGSIFSFSDLDRAFPRFVEGLEKLFTLIS